ncbi:MAG: outer membrane protein OmpA-like peptidoglycan-associated protein [Gammaproteobacteria bacterium]|jgi:outer membrane protein OmpA-like peptidoglycan-associated protein
MLWHAIGITLTATLIACSGSVRADEAASLYQRALAAPQSIEQVELLERSFQIRPTFEAVYALGMVHRAAEDPVKSLDAFKRALERAGTPRAEGLALARAGESLAYVGRDSEALQLLYRAIERAPDLPAWVHQERLKLDNALASQTMNAATITRALSGTTRAFGISPRVNLRVGFLTGKASLDHHGLLQVQELTGALRALGEAKHSYLLVGHTDKRGSAASNLSLSERRAQAVRNAIEVEYPEIAWQLCAEGRGETELQYSGNSTSEHRMNRRVEVVVLDRCN